MTVTLANKIPAKLYWSSSPPEFCAPNRTTDIDAILDLIKKARKFIYIAVMDYYAAIIYQYPRRLVAMSLIYLGNIFFIDLLIYFWVGEVLRGGGKIEI